MNTEKVKKACLESTLFFKKSFLRIQDWGTRFFMFLKNRMRHHPKEAGVFGFAFLLIALLYVGVSDQPVVVVVDSNKVFEQAEVYRLIREEREKYNSLWEARFLAEKEVLDQEDRALAQQQKKMKRSQFRKALSELQQKTVALQKKYQEQAVQINKASQSVLDQAGEMVRQSLQRVASREGYQIVLDGEGLMYYDSDLDVTDLFIEELNKQTVQIVFPDPDQLTITTEGEINGR